jgi:hypothetical protein
MKTSQKPSTYTRRLFVLTFKERLPGKTTGQRRGAHYRDVKTLSLFQYEMSLKAGRISNEK